TQLAGTKLSSIVAVGARLKEVVEAVDELDRNARLRAVTGIVHARFVAIAILLRRFDKAVRDRLLGRWERVTFRIFGIGDADARNKVGDYVRLGYDIAQGKLTADEIDASLKTLGSDYGIDKVLDQANWWDSYDGWTEELRYVLFRYDEYLASKSGGSLNANQWNQVWAAEPAQSIEHITPQSSGRSYIHHLGNLTVLPPGVNSSLRDKPPAKKAETYKTSGIRGTIQVGKRVEAAGKWTEEMILQRADEIIAFARKEWAD
ncbi:MAG TPA: HNH endonuclease family protein, partial [Caulobacteraceae bacterium]